jgi:hypothetical protein
MDTSAEYNKKCTAAREVQEDWKINAWDYCFCYRDKKVVVISGYEIDGGYYGHGVYDEEIEGCGFDKHIWLPRQDQLQEMIDTIKYKKLPFLFNNFIYCYDMGYEISAINVMPSMEQLWLAFVMKEKYSKVLNGEDWVVE